MKSTGWTIFAAVVVLSMGLWTPVMAQERDRDGSRMQARHVEVGSVHSGSLSPPEDEVDWRLVRLEERTTLGLELTVEPSQRRAELELTNATGEELASQTTGDDGATIRRTLGAGIYYIGVSSSQNLQYRLAIE